MTRPRVLRAALAMGLGAGLLCGCVAGGGYDNYGVGYYGAPYGAEFGAFEPGYAIGPFRGDHFRGGGPGFHHAWHGPSGGGGVPFIPSHGRGGGGHGSGGSHGGGGGGGGRGR